ncbi:MAG TPA: TetR/AcrR family transcriptional regulator [Gemmatimonadales bacterium]
MSTRRVPTQQRSRDRLARIARAAGELCAEAGADAVTMEGIAVRAGTSIGSLYQFFPNRDALLHFVAERYVEDLGRLLEPEEDPDAAHLPLEGLVDAMLSPFESFHRTHPGYFAVLFAPQGSAALATLRGRLREQLVARVERLLQLRAPDLPAARRRSLALTSVEAARALLQYAETHLPPARRRTMRDELRAMLVAYLERAGV